MMELGTAPSVVFSNSPALPATNEAPFDVEVPDPLVSPDDIDNLIRIARNWINGNPPTIGARKAAQEIVDRLSPPNPPTYEELLAALEVTTKYAMIDSDRLAESEYKEVQCAEKDAQALLDRARQAGLLK